MGQICRRKIIYLSFIIITGCSTFSRRETVDICEKPRPITISVAIPTTPLKGILASEVEPRKKFLEMIANDVLETTFRKLSRGASVIKRAENEELGLGPSGLISRYDDYYKSLKDVKLKSNPWYNTGNFNVGFG